jgi:hypothetical protein
MLTYNGNDANFAILIQQYNHSIQLFINPQTREPIRARVFSNLVAQLNSITGRASANWLEESRPSLNGNGHIGMVHYRELLANYMAIRQIMNSPTIYRWLTPAHQQLIGEIDYLTANLERTILLKENVLNRTLNNQVLQTMEYGAGIIVLAGLATAGVGGMLWAVGIAFCSVPTVTTGIFATKAGGAGIALGSTGIGIATVLQEPERTTIQPTFT